MFPNIDTKSAPAVAAAVQTIFRKMFPRTGTGLIDRLFFDVQRMFTGQHLDYQAADLRYHDFEHTLQAALCFMRLLAGRHAARVRPRLTSRQVELGLAAVLLHDTGYLKLRSDKVGTGAKYTHIHVLKSCAFAAAYLPVIGVNPHELSGVLGAIRCTGPSSDIARLHFNSVNERLIGCALATADYLAQMASPDYPDELGFLFEEFREADEFANIPPAHREFKSTHELMARTPAFWAKVVFPKLKAEYAGMYRFLAQPYPRGQNPYLTSVERNLATISKRLAGKKSRISAKK